MFVSHASESLMHSRKRAAKMTGGRAHYRLSNRRNAECPPQLWISLGSSVPLFEDSNALNLNVRVQGQCLYGNTS